MVPPSGCDGCNDTGSKSVLCPGPDSIKVGIKKFIESYNIDCVTALSFTITLFLFLLKNCLNLKTSKLTNIY
jgi:hypothetical protein